MPGSLHHLGEKRSIITRRGEGQFQSHQRNKAESAKGGGVIKKSREEYTSRDIAT